MNLPKLYRVKADLTLMAECKEDVMFMVSAFFNELANGENIAGELFESGVVELNEVRRDS